MPSPGAEVRYLRTLLATLALAVLPFLAGALYFGAPGGDLTRLGGWSERDYGWRAPQPVVEVNANRAAANPRALLLGDSFSMGNVWQSELQRRTGVALLGHGYEGAGCIDAFVRHALDPGRAQVELVVIETIEREFVDRFERLPPCGDRAPVPFDAPVGATAPGPPSGPPTLDWRYLTRTAVNALRLQRHPQATVRGREVVNVPLRAGAPFSSRAASRLLYYAGDDGKRHWTPERLARAVDNVAALQARIERAGKRLLVLVIPDKSTVYADYLLDAPPSAPDVAALLADRGVDVVGLLAPLRAAARTQVDLYLPNDTHLSPAGFRVLGALVADWPGFDPRPR